MKRWLLGSMLGLTAVFVINPIPTAGQTPPTAPYVPPRTPDGHPDLQGTWQVLNTAHWDLEGATPTLGVPAGHGWVEGDTIPYQPGALAKKKENFAKRGTRS